MARIELDEVSKSFRHRRKTTPVLDRVSLTVSDGEFVSLVGRSGCGKSTLLRIIGGFLSPDTGEVQVDGQLSCNPGSDRGMLFQQPMLFPWLTVLQSTMFGPRAQGKVTPLVRSRALAMLETVGLVGYEDHYPKQLSGGMLSRAAFARALMAEPKVLLMDEPFGALDALTRAGMQQFLLDLWQQQRFTILFVTHDVEEAVLLSDRVVIMAPSPGRIVDDISISLSRPRTYETSESNEFVLMKRQVRQAVEGTAKAVENSNTNPSAYEPGRS
jgi:ABC-type nitrate/sulfonate/bicarbonate transport system ATPase subunit